MHCGSKNGFLMLQENFIFKKMRLNIKLMLQNCQSCQKSKYSNQISYGKMKSIRTSKPNE